MRERPVLQRQPSPVPYDGARPHRRPRLLHHAVQPLRQPGRAPRGRVPPGQPGDLHRQGQAVPRKLAARAAPRLRPRRRRGGLDEQAHPDLPPHRQALLLGPAEGRRRRARPGHRRARRAHARAARAVRGARRHAGAALGPRPRRLEAGRRRPEALPLRGGAGAPARPRPAPGRAPRPGGPGPRPPRRRAAGRLRRAAAVRADRWSARDRRPGRRRAGPRPPDEPPPAGRGGLGQDARRPPRDAPGGRRRGAGRAARPDRGARPAAPPLDLRDARRPRPGRHARRRPPTPPRSSC